MKSVLQNTVEAMVVFGPVAVFIGALPYLNTVGYLCWTVFNALYVLEVPTLIRIARRAFGDCDGPGPEGER